MHATKLMASINFAATTKQDALGGFEDLLNELVDRGEVENVAGILWNTLKITTEDYTVDDRTLLELNSTAAYAYTVMVGEVTAVVNDEPA